MPSGYGGFYETFARFYDAFRPEREGEMAFYRAQAAAVSGAALEIGCGTGRVLIAVAESGKEVWGLDGSPAMLQVLEERLSLAATGTAARVVLRPGDMRLFELGRSFGSILIPYHTFQHLLTREDQLACLSSVRRHLEESGRLALDVAGFDPSCLPHRRSLVHLERRELIRPPGAERDLESVFSAEIDARSGLAVQTRTLSRGKELLLCASTEVRYLRAGELEGLLHAAGFRLVERAGGFRGELFEEGGEQVWVAELR